MATALLRSAIHPRAWKVNSAKSIFRFTEFLEVHLRDQDPDKKSAAATVADGPAEGYTSFV
jgi:hypothetical protein